MTDPPAGTRGHSESNTTSGTRGSTLRALNVVLRRRRAILGCALATASVAVGITVVTPAPPARVTATFRAPESVAAAIAELAAPEGGLRSSGGASEADAIPSARVDRVSEPDLWRVTTTSGDPERSLEMARRLLQAGRDVESSDEPEWLVEAWRAVREAETDRRRFVTENPEYESSPSLRAEYDLLERRIELRHAIVIEAERRELARRMNADPSVQGTDEMVVIDPPAVESSGGILYPALLGLVIGSLFGALWVLGREAFVGLSRRDPEAYREFRDLLESARRDLSRPWEMFRRSR